MFMMMMMICSLVLQPISLTDYGELNELIGSVGISMK